MTIRQVLQLPLGDPLIAVREFLHPAVFRAGLARCMRWRGLSQRSVKEEATTPATRTFKDCSLGCIHMDIEYLPQMPDETPRRYLFVAIRRATRWVCLRISDQSEDSSIAPISCAD